MSPRIVRCYGIYKHPPQYPGWWAIWGWRRLQKGFQGTPEPILVESLQEAQQTVERLLGPGARQVRSFDPNPVEVWGVRSVEPLSK